MSQNRYSSNASALGSDIVSKLGSSCVAVRGNNSVAQSAIYCLIGLGIGEIKHIAGDDELRPGILRTLTDSVLPEGADCTSLRESLAYIAPQLKYSQTSDVEDCAIKLDSEKFNVCALSKKTYSCVGNLIAGTLLADEFRKNVGLVSRHEQKLPSDQGLSIDLGVLLHKSCSNVSPRKLDRVLVIGAGGLGTYCTYALSRRGVSEIILCEPDIIEEPNLNRQLLYTGRVGDLKADVLSERLSNKKSRIIPRVEFFDETFESRGKLDAIFCCTDTLESRISASNYAQRHKIPLVEGACTPTMGSVTTYIPGLTKTISEQRDLHELLRLKNVAGEQRHKDAKTQDENSCARVSNPSVISPNVIIGCLQAISLDNKHDSSGDLIENYPQIYLNLLRNSKFSQGVL